MRGDKKQKDIVSAICVGLYVIGTGPPSEREYREYVYSQAPEILKLSNLHLHYVRRDKTTQYTVCFNYYSGLRSVSDINKKCKSLFLNNNEKLVEVLKLKLLLTDIHISIGGYYTYPFREKVGLLFAY